MSEPPKRVESPYDEIQLDSITEPPTDLRDLSVNEAVEIIRDWFFDNFEDPANSTPYEKGYIYIWGGPYDADEVVREMIGDEATEEQLEAAIDSIQADGLEWAPDSARVQPPEEDDDRPDPPSAEALYARMLESIEAVEKDLAEIGAPGIGHNNPPEAMEEPPYTEADQSDLEEALDALRAQPVEPPKDAIPAIEAAQGKVASFLQKVSGYLAKQADNFVTEAVKAVGKVAGVAGAGAVALMLPGLAAHLQELLHTIGSWLATVSIPF